MKKLAFFALVVGLIFLGCDTGNGTTGGNNSGTTGGNANDTGEALPKSSGINAVGGKTYYEGAADYKIVFSATADGTASGTYTVGRTVQNEDTYGYVLVNGKYTYFDQKIGTYSWNEETKTVTLKPEKDAYYGENGWEVLRDRADSRKRYQAFLDSAKERMGEEAFNQAVLSEGFSSITDFINYELNEVFSNKTYDYSFSTDGTALFLEELLPANKGTNELIIETYYGWNSGKDENRTYVFTASGYTYNTYTMRTITGSYAYDSSRKHVWLRPEKINGKDRAAYYAEQTVYEHHLVDDNAYCAAQTNEQFRIMDTTYNNTNKTIGSY